MINTNWGAIEKSKIIAIAILKDFTFWGTNDIFADKTLLLSDWERAKTITYNLIWKNNKRSAPQWMDVVIKEYK